MIKLNCLLAGFWTKNRIPWGEEWWSGSGGLGKEKVDTKSLVIVGKAVPEESSRGARWKNTEAEGQCVETTFYYQEPGREEGERKLQLEEEETSLFIWWKERCQWKGRFEETGRTRETIKFLRRWEGKESWISLTSRLAWGTTVNCPPQALRTGPDSNKNPILVWLRHKLETAYQAPVCRL